MAPTFAYAVSDLSKDSRRVFAKANGNLPALHADKVALITPPAGSSPESHAQLVQITATMPSDAGVSLEVTDQVRGFSNTTHVASDVEVQGENSTIHVEADGD